MITKEQIQHLARLARLQLTDQELGQYAPQLDEIVAFVGHIQEASSQKADQGLSTEVAPLRIDEGALRSKENQEDLLSRAPVREGNFIKTQGIFED